MTTLIRGQRLPLSSLMTGTHLTLQVHAGLPGTDIALFSLDAQGKLSEGRSVQLRPSSFALGGRQ